MYVQYSTCAGLKMHPTGKFLYGSNRGHDSIVVFAIDSTDGTLTWVANEMTGGKQDASGGAADDCIRALVSLEQCQRLAVDDISETDDS